MPTFRHAKNTRVLVDGTDLSRAFNQANLGANQDTPETTGFTSTIKSYVVGLPDGKLDLQGMFSADWTGKKDIDDYFHSLTNTTTPSVVSYYPEGLPGGIVAGSNLVAGRRRAYSFQGYLSNYQVHGAVADLVGVQAGFQNASSQGFNSGVVLEDGLTAPVSTAATVAYGVQYYDYGSSAARSGWLALHVVDFNKASATGSWVIKIGSATTTPGTAGSYTDTAATLTIATGQAAPIGAAIFVPVTNLTLQYLSVSITAPTTPASTTLTYACSAYLA